MIIAEIGQNHNGNMQLAKKLIVEAATNGAEIAEGAQMAEGAEGTKMAEGAPTDQMVTESSADASDQSTANSDVDQTGGYIDSVTELREYLGQLGGGSSSSSEIDSSVSSLSSLDSLSSSEFD